MMCFTTFGFWSKGRWKSVKRKFFCQLKSDQISFACSRLFWTSEGRVWGKSVRETIVQVNMQVNRIANTSLYSNDTPSRGVDHSKYSFVLHPCRRSYSSQFKKSTCFTTHNALHEQYAHIYIIFAPFRSLFPNHFNQRAMNRLYCLIVWVCVSENMPGTKKSCAHMREKKKIFSNRLMIWFLNNQAPCHVFAFGSIRLGTFSLLFYTVGVFSSVEICLRVQQTAHPPTTLSNSLFHRVPSIIFSCCHFIYASA